LILLQLILLILLILLQPRHSTGKFLAKFTGF